MKKIKSYIKNLKLANHFILTVSSSLTLPAFLQSTKKPFNETFFANYCQVSMHQDCRKQLFSKPKYTILYLSVSNSWKFLRIWVVFLLLNIDPKIGGARSFFALKISIKRAWMLLCWLHTSLFFCNNFLKSLVCSVC